MLAEQQSQLIACLQAAVRAILPQAEPNITLERPKVAAHGDAACNIAMQLAKPAGRNPRELAQQIVDTLLADPNAAALLAGAEIAGPGFINFRLSTATHQAVLKTIAEQGDRFGHLAPTQEKLMVEFVSANPTGPLHVGHAAKPRWATRCAAYSAPKATT